MSYSDTYTTDHEEKLLKLVCQNPFRILGVFSNASLKEITANKTKLARYASVGKSVSFDADMNGLLPPVTRTTESVEKAFADLSLSQDKLKHAMLWFMKCTSYDEDAFSKLAAGNVKEAKLVWEVHSSLSSVQNRIVCSLISNDLETALMLAEYMYSDLSLCDSFINAVDANSTLKIGNEELLHLFIDSLGEEIGLYKLYQIDSLQLGTKEYIKNKLVTPLLSKISEEVEKAKNTDSRDSEKRKKAGEYLMVNTKNPLEELRKVLGLSDAQYGLVADKVGQTILQCGIDYFNGSDDNDAIFKALELQRYARSVVVGHIAKQRCDENIRILEKNAENTPPSKVVEEFNAINKLLEEASEQPDEICYSIELLNSTKPYLQSIKSKLGATNTHYLKISTLVVSVALHKLVQVVNEAQKEPETFLGNSDPFGLGAGFRSNYYNLTGQRYTSAEVIQRTTEAVAEAWPAIFLMDGFDIEPSFKEHYNKNRSTLRSLCERFGIQYKTKEELQKEKKDKTKKVLCIIVGIVLIESIWAIIGHDEIGNALLVSLGAWTLFPINILALMGFLKLCERIFKIEI